MSYIITSSALVCRSKPNRKGSKTHGKYFLFDIRYSTDAFKSKFGIKDPLIMDVHEFYLYEWSPFQICISLHIVINDRLIVDKNQQIVVVLNKVRQYFNENFYVYTVNITPELVKVS